MNIEREKNGIGLVEIDGLYYVVGIDRYASQVRSVLAADMPSGGGYWVAGISEGGVRYVGHGATRQTATRAFRRASAARN